MLNKIFEKHACDKASRHMYYKVYEPHFENKREEPLKILEIGILKGASIDSWHEYLPNAEIYGIDIFTRVKQEDVPALKKDRVFWLKGDSMDSSIQDKIKKQWGDIKFDVIIDDGLHTPEANSKTLKNLMPFLKDDGVFYIEDVWPLDIMTPEQWNHSWMKKNSTKYNMTKWKMFENAIKEYKVAHHDLRSYTNIFDSYIYEIRK
jgi:cephalosporin hydroxylase